MPKRKRLQNQGWGTDFIDFLQNFWLFWSCLARLGSYTPLRARMRRYVRVRVGLVCSFTFCDDPVLYFTFQSFTLFVLLCIFNSSLFILVIVFTCTFSLLLLYLFINLYNFIVIVFTSCLYPSSI